MLRPLIYRSYHKFFGPCKNTLHFQVRKLCHTSSTYKNSDSSDCNKTEQCNDKSIKSLDEKKNCLNLHNEIEDAMNEQINVELKAFYCYLSMTTFFGRMDIALPGCESFFMQMHHEEHEHALKILNYIKLRGGKVHLCPISPPKDQDWKSPLHAFKTALKMEIDISKKLVAVNAIAEKHGDLSASNFIIDDFIENQMKSINEMGRLVSILSSISDQTLARFMFDKDLLENYVISDFNVLKCK